MFINKVHLYKLVLAHFVKEFHASKEIQTLGTVSCSPQLKGQTDLVPPRKACSVLTVRSSIFLWHACCLQAAPSHLKYNMCISHLAMYDAVAVIVHLVC
jgi:hypothetical protein